MSVRLTVLTAEAAGTAGEDVEEAVVVVEEGTAAVAVSEVVLARAGEAVAVAAAMGASLEGSGMNE